VAFTMFNIRGRRGPVAQRLEQGTHNPLVPGSNPGGPSSESFRGCHAEIKCRRAEQFRIAECGMRISMAGAAAPRVLCRNRFH
jgi:hypothetical protein